MLFSWRDPETWQPLLRATAGRRPSVSRVLSLLQVEYAGVRAFHGCRPQDVDAYYRDGIRRADFDDLDTQARKIFLTDEFPEITAAHLDTTIASISSLDRHVVHVILDDRVLLKYSGHYLVYGSERICAIAAALSPSGYPDYRQVLKRYGRPTVFEVSVPWDAPTEHELQRLAEEVRDHLSVIRRSGSVPELDFTVTLHETIPPRQVLSHYHPPVVVDPLVGMVKYRFSDAAT